MKILRRRLLIVLIGPGLVAAAWLAIGVVGAWQFRTELREATRDLAARRVGEAKARLDRLARRWPGRGEVQYWLGACERAVGHTDAALAAWGRVPETAPVARLAALERGRLALESYRYALAESCLERAIPGEGEIGDEARRLLGRLHTVTGRHEDYRRYLRREVEREPDPTGDLRTLWQVDHMPYPVERSRRELERARQVAPDDDRVWLALADLATRTGRFEEAEGWLNRCERARPDDRAVWRARLDWAQAADRPDEVVRAASHLPASLFAQARVLELRAWMAAGCGDRQAERGALESKLALEPADSAAVERLADLATQDGEWERLAELRRRKAAIDAARAHYQELIRIPDLTAHIPELARAAEASGRRFDARAWWALAARRDRSIAAEAEAALARLAAAKPASEHGERALADLLGPFRPRGTATTAASGTSGIPAFTDDAERRGVAFTFDNGHSDLYQLPETFGGGVAVLDFDGDGWLDIYAVQGGPFPPRPDPQPPFGDRLFRNRGDGRFDDVTATLGLGALKGGYGFGVAVGDFDNDGRPDIFVTRWRCYALYHNLGDGRFEDVTADAGLGGERDWPSSAAWADLDNDGDLDLYVCHYLKWDAADPLLCAHSQGRHHGYCDPRLLPSLPDHVFRNDGGRFIDVTEQAGIVDREGRGLGVVASDLDDDGKVDLFVANDTTANYFFRNQGGFRFTEEGQESGLAASAHGSNLAGMGVACGDFDGDGRLDLAVTNYLGESTTLYHNHGEGRFSDRAAASGLAAPTRFVLGFGLSALDANNDGRLDLAQANGHVDDYRPAVPYLMPAQLFLGNGAGRLVDVSDRVGLPWRRPRLGRGLAVGDLDNDGRTDVIIVAQNAPLALLHNQAASPNHFLTLALEGTDSNRDAVGARVAVTASGKTRVATRSGGGSYLSASDHRLHFGLGPARKVDRVEVTWPTGRRDCYRGLAADAGYRLREGDTVPRRLPGFAPSTIRQ